MLLGSQQSTIEDDYSNATEDTLSNPITSYETTTCLETDIHKDIQTIATYIAQERALASICLAFERISKTCIQRVKETTSEKTTTKAI